MNGIPSATSRPVISIMSSVETWPDGAVWGWVISCLYIRNAPAGACSLLSGIQAIPQATRDRYTYCRIFGYPFHDGKNDSVEKPEIVIRFYPNSNPQHQFFFTQAGLDAAATKLGLSRDFSTASRTN